MSETVSELMQGMLAEYFIPGDPAGADRLAQELLRVADVFVDAGRALGRVEVEWTGPAADAFQGEFQLQPAAFAAAGRAFDDAGYAMGSYAIAFDSARQLATAGVELFQRGLAAAHAAQDALAAAGGMPVTETPLFGPPPDLRGEPAGLADREAGAAQVDHARRIIVDAGDRAVVALRAAMAAAPEQVSAWTHATNFLGTLATGQPSEEATDFFVGGARGVLDLMLDSMAVTNPFLFSPLLRKPVNDALDDLEWRHNVGIHSGYHHAGDTILPTLLTGGLGGEGAAAREIPELLSDAIETKGLNEAPTDLYAFGNATRPRAPRPGQDVIVDSRGDVILWDTDWPYGASTYNDPVTAGLKGPYHRVPKGTPLPSGLRVIQDDRAHGGPHGRGHASIFPTQPMSFDTYAALLLDMPWVYAGRIRK